jgi:hypothetical protein
MMELAVATVVGAFALVFGAGFVAIVDCGSDDACSRGGQLQFAVAFIGLAPALGMLIANILGRGRRGLWFCTTALLWAVWLILVWRL